MPPRAARDRAARSSWSRSTASSSSISVTPMIALSGVRSSWVMLARNCDLCWLASELPALLLDLAEEARVVDRDHRLVGEGRRPASICFSVNGCTLVRVTSQHADQSTLAQQRHAEHGPKFARLLPFRPGVFRIGKDIRDVDCCTFEGHSRRPQYPRPGGICRFST